MRKSVAEKKGNTKFHDELSRLVDRGYAVALRKITDDLYHARAVRDGKVIEADRPTMREAISTVLERTRRKKKNG